MMKLFPFSLSLNNNLLTLLLCFSHRHSLSTNAMAQYGGRQLILRHSIRQQEFSVLFVFWSLAVEPTCAMKLNHKNVGKAKVWISNIASAAYCLSLTGLSLVIKY